MLKTPQLAEKLLEKSLSHLFKLSRNGP